MTAPTQGQAAYEAFTVKRRIDVGEGYTPLPWDARTEDAENWRDAWEAAAQAAIDSRVAAMITCADGGTVIVAFNKPISPREADELHERWGEYGPETLKLVIADDVATIAALENL